MLHLFKQSRHTINDKIPECGIIDYVVDVSDKVFKSDNLSISWNLLREIKMRLGEVYVVG